MHIIRSIEEISRAWSCNAILEAVYINILGVLRTARPTMMLCRRASIAVLLLGAFSVQAQLDEDKRELVQVGYNQPIEGNAPLSAYAFYYLNIPHFYRTNLYLRAAIAPVYLDSELGFKSALGEHTDVGVGVSGGGFADGYFEVRDGQFLRTESFSGHGGGASASIYHLFNPNQRVPLNAVLRAEAHYSTYERDTDTSRNFALPDDRTSFHLRSGLRWGGREPTILPAVALELSAWYEGQFRTDAAPYGFLSDRRVNPNSHLFWSRALFTYTLPELKHNFNLNITMGASIDADRFSAYRLGGVLPLASEFPLTLPGYYFQEISARNFVLMGGSYSIPLDRKKRWAFNAQAATAAVDYLPGLRQPHPWQSGVGAGLIYRSPSDAWQVLLGYGYGIDAIRSHGYGAHNIGILVQFDLERAHVSLFEPGENPIRSRGLERIIDALKIF